MHALTHLAIIWAAVFVCVVAAKKTRLTPVLYFLFAGFVLVNTGVLPEESEEFIREFAELGIILIMFALGFEETTDNFVSSLKKSWGIALFGALAPFAVTYVIADYIWNDTSVSLMCGLAMTATAVSLTLVSLKSEGLQDSPVATRIMTSALIDDIGSLVAVAVVVPIAVSGEAISPIDALAVGAKAVLFFVVVTMLGGWIFPHRPTSWFRHVPFIGQHGVHDLLTFDKGQQATLTVLLAALFVGLLATYFGFHPAVGAYMAGLIFKEEYFRHVDDDSDKSPKAAAPDVYLQTKKIIDNAAFSWIGPVFFVDLGTKILFERDVIISVLPYAALLFVGIVVAQTASAALAARYTGSMNWPESVMIGLGMLGRAELAFVVIDIAYVQNDILPKEAFFTLMITAFFLNIAVPVGIRLWRPRLVGH